MTMPTQAQAPSWRVTGQTRTTQVAPDGTPVQGVLVSFQTGTGATGTVFFPQAVYTNLDTVRETLAAAAAHADAVQTLSSES